LSAGSLTVCVSKAFAILSGLTTPAGPGSGAAPESHAGVAFPKPDSGTTNGSRRQAIDPRGARPFAQRLLNVRLRIALVRGHRHPSMSYFSLCGIYIGLHLCMLRASELNIDPLEFVRLVAHAHPNN
jgi:hypothetical protein